MKETLTTQVLLEKSENSLKKSLIPKIAQWILFLYCVVFTILLIIFMIEIKNVELVGVTFESQQNRNFTVDYNNDQFLMDGTPFRIISGSFHYFRAIPETWKRKLRIMRAAGLNTISTYVEWSLHNPKDGVYNWEGMGNLVKFIELAAEEDLYVILRPGPYICAERDMGGFPYWLLNKYPQIQLRTDDPNYLREVRIWYKELLTRMQPYLYGNGGPIILVQVENEYGFSVPCNRNYQSWLKEETSKYVQNKAVLFTNDVPDSLHCGKINNILAGLDFGPTSNSTVEENWEKLRKFQKKGPKFVAEFYTGWLTHWQEQMQRVPTEIVIKTFEKLLSDGANVNFYMFYGGTNFGFTAGGNNGGPGRYNSDVTSYDYDAPMDESGDPTEKYFAIRNSISKFLPLPDIPVPQKTGKIKLPDIQMKPIALLFQNDSRKYLGKPPVGSKEPLSFEFLDQNTGFLLYETELPETNRDPVVLSIDRLRDRAYIFVQGNFQGILERANKAYTIPLSLASGKSLQILVENEGRVNSGEPDFKGILSKVQYGQVFLKNWSITGFPLEDYLKIENLIGNHHGSPCELKDCLRFGPLVFHTEFELTENEVFDTFLDPTGWGKGIAFINGFNLGRYWPLVGPQITLYIPKELLKVGTNKLTIIELEKIADQGILKFSEIAKLDGK